VKIANLDENVLQVNFGAAVVNLMQHGDGLPLGDTTYTEPVQSCGGADIDILIDM